MKTSRFRLALMLAGALCLRGQSLEEFEKRVTEFTLPNGMHFIVLERHEAPVVSFHAYVDAGAVDDPSGKTSMAHMFEHMIGKGTTTLGTKNWPEEKKALEAVERVYDRLEAEKNKGARADEAALARLTGELKAAIEKANSYVEPNVYIRVIEESGGEGFNAGTGQDATTYFYSLPANKAELWFLLQSDWFLRPVFREFYKERDVVREERRMRVESSPQGKLQEVMMATAFAAHPYRTLIGWASDIENLRAKDAEVFFRTYYVPSNITIAIAGDVDPKQMRSLAEKYYGRLPAGPPPPRLTTIEPVQEGEKRATVGSPAQPVVLLGYKRPDQNDPDDVVLDVVAGLMSSGRTGLLYKELVRDKKLALGAAAYATIPAGKYPNLFFIAAAPNPGRTVEENLKAIYEIVEGMKKNKPEPAALERVKTKIRASLIRQLDSNAGLASQLAYYHVNYRSWRKLFTGIEEINKVTGDDVQRVMNKYFRDESRTVAYTVPAKAEGK